MIGAGLGFWSGGEEDYLAGNAKVYDGSFDYDKVLSWIQRDWNQPFSINVNLNILSINRFQRIVVQGESFIGSNPGARNFEFFITNTNQVAIFFRGTGGILQATSATNSVTVGRKSIIMSYDGSGTAAGINFYVNNALLSKTSTGSIATGSIASAITSLSLGVTSQSTAGFLNANVRILEIINRVAAAGEIAAASATGSFRGAGIAYSSGEYLLAIETDKVNGQNLTTFAGTPSYTITAFGGATYTPYL